MKSFQIIFTIIITSLLRLAWGSDINFNSFSNSKSKEDTYKNSNRNDAPVSLQQFTNHISVMNFISIKITILNQKKIILKFIACLHVELY